MTFYDREGLRVVLLKHFNCFVYERFYFRKHFIVDVLQIWVLRALAIENCGNPNLSFCHVVQDSFLCSKVAKMSCLQRKVVNQPFLCCDSSTAGNYILHFF